MKVSKFLFLTFIFIFLVTTISADTITRPYGKQFDLKRPCFNNGTFCSGSAVCNMTVEYPNGEIMINNQLMTNKVAYRNVTINQTVNNQLGFHPATMVCCDTGGDVKGCAEDTFELEITADGFPGKVFPTQFVIIILGFLLVGTSFTTERLSLFRYIGAIILFVMGVLTLYPGYQFINWTTLMGKGLGFGLIGLGFYFMIEDSFSRKEQAPAYDINYEEED